MKLKSDFVTNSSSTSYIVAIAKNVTFTKQEILETNQYQNYVTYEEEATAEEYVNTCLKGLKELKNEKPLYAYGFETDIGEPYEAFYSIIELLNDKELILLGFESDSDDGKILSLDKEKIMKAFLALSDDILSDTCLKDIVKGKVKND